MKTFSELLAHEVREADPQVSVHLLIPGFTFTDLTRRDRVEKPGGRLGARDRWPMRSIDGMDAGDFYILCPDNDVSRELDAEAHGLGDGRHHPQSPAAVALASRTGRAAFADFAQEDLTGAPRQAVSKPLGPRDFGNRVVPARRKHRRRA